MVKVADVMSQAARRCRVGRLTDIATSNSETALELRDCLNETVEEILDRLDFIKPITSDTSISVGVGDPPISVFQMPSDFVRLTRDENAVIETTMSRRRCTPVSDNGAWTALLLRGASAGRFYRLAGNSSEGFSVEFYRPLSSGTAVTISYVSNLWIKNDAEYKSSWTDATDDLLLPEDLCRLGVIWRFKQAKGLAYADAQAEYEIRLSRRINDSRGIRVVDIGDSGDDYHPMRVPVPDVINFG